MERLVWFYAKGRPTDDGMFAWADFARFGRSVVAIVCDNVSNPSERAAIAQELRRLVSRSGLHDVAADVPRPPAPEPRRVVEVTVAAATVAEPVERVVVPSPPRIPDEVIL
jgi:hypothetical protein